MKINARMIVYSLVIFTLLMFVIITSGFILMGESSNVPRIAGAQEDVSLRSVSVTGTGAVQVTPDTAIVRLGVFTEAEAAEDALEQNNQEAQAVIDAVREAGVEQENIQTAAVHLDPIFADTPDSPQGMQVEGYRARNVITVTIMDLAVVGEMIDAAVAAGANTIESISFHVRDPGAALSGARELAVADAREKAEELAALTGSQLGAVQTITETDGEIFPRTIPLERDEAVVPIEPGTQDTRVTVQVVWRLLGGFPDDDGNISTLEVDVTPAEVTPTPAD